MVKLPDIGLGAATLLKASLPEFIDAAARHGFRRITARPFMVAEALRQGWTEAGLKQHLSDAGVEITMIDGLNNGLPGVPGPETLEPAVRAVMPPDVVRPMEEGGCLWAARVLGVNLLNVVAYRGQVMPLEQMAAAVGALCRRAAPFGVYAALEFLPDSGIPDLGYAARILEACGEPNCGITLDVFHLARSGGTAADIRRLRPGAVAAIQISDRDPHQGAHVPFGGRLMPGDGGLPLTEMVTAALENNPDATLDIEVLNVELSGLPTDEAAQRLASGASVWRAAFLAESAH